MKYILVDFFDTLVHRKYSVDIVKNKWAHLISEYLNYCVDEKTIYYYRIAAENDMAIIFNEYDNEYKLEEMFLKVANKLNVHHKLDLNLEEFAHKACEINYDIELNNLYLNHKLIKYLTRSKNENNKIICISDNEYCLEFYKQAFFKLEINDLFDNIYVSSEYRKAKRSGNLYKQFLSDYNCNPEDCMMIGDNKHSDCIIPKNFGIKTKKISPFQGIYNKQNKQFFDYKYNLKILKHYFVRKDNKYCNYIFPLYEFCDKLYKNLVKNNQQDVFFFAREGQFLKKVFDEYQKNKVIKINTYYICVSRASTFVASLKPIEEEKFQNLFRQYSNICVEEFLKSLSFDSNIVNLLVKKYGNQRIEHFNTSDIFNKLIKDNEFLKEYNKLVKDQQENFKNYINSVCNHFNNLQQINIVDVGWKGTIQDNISNIYKDKVIHGYYIGLNQEGSIGENNLKDGLLFDLNVGKHTIYNLEWLNWEYLLKADHGKTIKYNKIDDKYEPFLLKDGDVDCYKTYINLLQDKMFKCFIKLLEIENKNYNFQFLYQNCQQLYRELICGLKYKDLVYMDKIKNFHSESFGVFGNKMKGQLTFLTRVKKYIKIKLIKLGLYKKY